MYHVAPMIPNPSIDKQQLDRKRHLGNDIVVLLFRDAVRLSENLHPLHPPPPFRILFYSLYSALTRSDRTTRNHSTPR